MPWPFPRSDRTHDRSARSLFHTRRPPTRRELRPSRPAVAARHRASSVLLPDIVGQQVIDTRTATPPILPARPPIASRACCTCTCADAYTVGAGTRGRRRRRPDDGDAMATSTAAASIATSAARPRLPQRDTIGRAEQPVRLAAVSAPPPSRVLPVLAPSPRVPPRPETASADRPNLPRSACPPTPPAIGARPRPRRRSLRQRAGCPQD